MARVMCMDSRPYISEMGTCDVGVIGGSTIIVC